MESDPYGRRFWARVLEAYYLKTGKRSLQALARMVGMPPTTLQRKVREGRMPRLDRAVRIARVLDMEWNELLHVVDPEGTMGGPPAEEPEEETAGQ